MPFRILLAIPVTELEARLTLGARAQQLWQELHAQLDTLKTLARDLKRRSDQDPHERARRDMVSVAIEHLEQAMAALELASQE